MAVDFNRLESTRSNICTKNSVFFPGGCGIHLEVICESPRFVGLEKVKQHKLVAENLSGTSVLSLLEPASQLLTVACFVVSVTDIMESVDAHALTIHTRLPKPKS
jgi:stress-induced morphogen